MPNITCFTFVIFLCVGAGGVASRQIFQDGEMIKTLKGHGKSVTSVSFSPNNQYVVSGSGDRTVRIWSVESGECVTRKTLEGHTDKVHGVSFSPNNQYVVSGSWDKTVRI